MKINKESILKENFWSNIRNYGGVVPLDILEHHPAAKFCHELQYKIIYSISNIFEEELFLDLGTCMGASAVAMAASGKNNVVSCDISDSLIDLTVPNIKFIKARAQDLVVDMCKDSTFIVLDVDPHDGVQEKEIMELLIHHKFNGILLCDDIAPYPFPKMNDWWNSINLPKINMTDFGHKTGTGVVFFNEHYRKFF